MRLFFAVPLIVACAVTAPAFAQSSSPPAQADRPASVQRVASQEDAAAAALALTMRHQAEQDRRIAEIACRAGDQKKCEVLKTQAQPEAKASGQ